MTKLILASGSPRRKELLEKVGYTFEIIPSHAPEIVSSTQPAKVVEELSALKAEDIFEKLMAGEVRSTLLSGDGEEPKDADFVVLGADTIVAADNEIMGKPTDKDHAFAMLKSLQDTWHSVYTGVTLLGHVSGRRVKDTFHVQTKVKFYALSDEEILEYLSDPEYKDKAGSYAIQGLGTLLVEKIDGDFNNVVGLPVAAVHRHLKEMIQAGNISED